MTRKEHNQQIYLEARIAAGCSQNDWARLFNLTPNSKEKQHKGQSIVSLKETGKRGVSMAECLAAELLRLFNEKGFDVQNLDFDENGRITSIPKKK